MTAEYSAQPALASAQLQRAELANNNNSQSHHRRHNAANSNKSAAASSGSSGSSSSPTKLNTKLATKISATNTDAAAVTILPTLPDRTAAATAINDVVVDDDDDCVSVSTTHIDCCFDDDDDVVNIVNSSIDETDHVQHRFSRTSSNSQQQHITCTCSVTSSTQRCSHTQHPHHPHQQQQYNCTAIATSTTSTTICDAAAHSASSTSCGIVGGSCGASSGISSAGSSPSASTTSSPLSTPTRLVNTSASSHHCCQKAAAAAVGGTTLSAAASTSSSHPHHYQQQHQHHTQQHNHHPHHHHHHHPNHHNVAGCKKLQKFDPRLGPSPYRQLLPIALCILSFATVFSILIVYMDTTEIRHQQFRINMSREYVLNNVTQDDPQLIAFLRQIHMKKYPMHYLFKNRDASEQQQHQQHLNFSEHHELTPEMAHYVADLVGGKLNGAVIQSLPGVMGQMMTAPWLAGTLNWAGVIVEPEPQRYFALRKQNALYNNMQVVHACVSPNEHTKEVTIHNEEADVRINSLLDEETSWFNTRVKCFPLYSIMLACNRIDYDLLSLGVHGHELEILQTLPFDKIKIEVISIHLPEDHENVRNYMQTVTKFLKGKSYKLQRNFGRNYFYQKINSRKKDILLMKQP